VDVPGRVRVTLADRIVPGGFFVDRPDAPTRTPFEGSLSDDAMPYRHCWTYAGGGSTIRGELVAMLDAATEKVFVGTLFLGDRAVREALERAADRLRGGVYVISALDDKGLDKAINTVDDDGDIDKQTEYRNFRELTRRGIYVRGYPGLHAKFVVVDDRLALVSSANLVSRSFDQVGENGVVVTRPADATHLARLFARLWEESPWDMPPDREHYQVRPRAAAQRVSQVSVTETVGNGPIWTYAAQHSILDAISEIIDSAQHELVLASYSIANMTHSLPRMVARPELLFEPVRRAIDRGVRVSLLLRGRNNVQASRVEAKAFAEAGVEVYADRLTHGKAAIADGRLGALFSANFLTDLGLVGGVEVGMRVDDTPALAEALRYYKHVIAEADLAFVRDPSLGALAKRLYAEALSRWPLPAVITLISGDAGWQRLADGTGPVLFERSGSGSVTLHSGQDRWLLTASGKEANDGYRLDPLPGKTVRSATEQLEAWLTTRQRVPEGIHRGLCPAAFVRPQAGR
jgi:Phosphatidylserine/phosphatidylglycerophosphate/cardiolipin synthases and related enzymes